MNIYEDWKAKLESAYSFMLKYSKITVWTLLDHPDQCAPPTALFLTKAMILSEL